MGASHDDSKSNKIWSRWRKALPRSEPNDETDVILSKIIDRTPRNYSPPDGGRILGSHPGQMATAPDMQVTGIDLYPKPSHSAPSSIIERQVHRNTIAEQPRMPFHQSYIQLAQERRVSMPLSAPHSRAASPVMRKTESIPSVGDTSDIPALSRMNSPEQSIISHTNDSLPRSPSPALDKNAVYTYVPPVAEDEIKATVQVSSLDNYIHSNGFLMGEFSDVNLLILGKLYPVHRLILCRVEFFRQIFCGPRAVGNNSISVYIEDPGITSSAVDSIISWIYGAEIKLVNEPLEESTSIVQICSETVLSVLRAAVLFQIYPLIEQCLNYIINYDLCIHHRRKLHEKNFAELAQRPIDTPSSTAAILRYIDFLETYQFSQPVIDKIEDALLSYLCTEGYEHLQDVFVQLPLAWLEKVLEADAFWCPNDYSRYEFARAVILQRRLNSMKMESPDDKKASETVFADIFRYGMIYANMTFEQLNEVKMDGLVPVEVLEKALSQHTQFRSFTESFKKPASAASSPTDQESSSNMESDENSFETCEDRPVKKTALPPLRIGVRFQNVHKLSTEERIYSRMFFFGGSWWSVFLQRFSGAKTKQEKWGVFLRRAEGNTLTLHASETEETDLDLLKTFENSTTASSAIQVLDQTALEPIQCPLSGVNIERSASYFHDPRESVDLSFKLFNPLVRAHSPIFESKVNKFAENQSWGYRSRDNVVCKEDLVASEIVVDGEAPVNVKFSIILNFHQ